MSGPRIPIKTPPPGIGHRGANRSFNILEGELKRFFHRENDLPIAVCLRAFTELINRNSGRDFLLPSLSDAAGSKISLSSVQRHISVVKVQEGADSHVFKVSAGISAGAGETKIVHFCLNISRSPLLNGRQFRIFQNLKKFRNIDPRYLVRPFQINKGIATHEERKVELAVYSTEWLEDRMEVNMCNAAEHPALHGLEVAGLRKMLLNSLFFNSFEEGLLEGAKADNIAAEMVRILTLYFNPRTGEYISRFGINSGDFVYRDSPDETPELKLVTIREYNKFQVEDGLPSHFTAALFITMLLQHREVSVTKQSSMGSREEVERFSIYVFSAKDVARGIKKALIEKHGAETARKMLAQWLGAYLIMSDFFDRALGFESKDAYLRHVMARQEMIDFMAEEKYQGTIEI